ncbi:MAG: phosphatidylserine decarboxylase family protein [Prevotellaceae bacterium]|jgi:phosphatidylserine decarboxylase|nr:phosphatidylserine decarboxylase family protein [Prevotellaceae bacterium]
MKLHKEGKNFILSSGVIFLLSLSLAVEFYTTWWLWVCSAFLGTVAAFMMRFFRVPNRPIKEQPNAILSPCDGTVVIIQEVEETEYFKDKRLQVSVFMSVNNVHINWVPMTGVIKYFRHHQGKYLVAWHPKSSEKNERTTFVLNNGKTEILFRQIAGYVARRIVTYVDEGNRVFQNQQLGFIKFGSRMDLFLPLNTEICVKKGDKVRGTETIIAKVSD